MSELDEFAKRIAACNCLNSKELSIKQARNLVKEINDFLYTNYEGIGQVGALDDEFDFFSDFHKYWHNNHKEILNIIIDESACSNVAEALHEVYIRTNGRAFYEIYDTNALTKEDICRIRFLTANQDFRGSRRFVDLANIFISDKSVFDEQSIFNDPSGFIRNIGITDLSQSDKRSQFAKNISSFLLDKNVQPYNIIDYYDRDVFVLRNAVINEPNTGYGNKKMDMFIRDMIVLDVWDNYTGFEKIDVASDVNTIKVALRTGIIKSSIPLVSSFIDIFCYQYGYVDELNALAWRRVWEIWSDKYPNEKIESPCLLDYFVYNVIGRQFCKEILCEFKCNDEGHTFKWHSSRNRTCQTCYSKGIYNKKATLIKKILPCTDESGSLAIIQTEFYRSGIAQPNYDICPFKEVCIGEGNFRLQPPKSISIKGQTGWTTAYAKKDQGGGGLMA